MITTNKQNYNIANMIFFDLNIQYGLQTGKTLGTIMPGLSCSEHSQLNEVVNQGVVKHSSVYKIKCADCTLLQKNNSLQTAKALLILFF